MPKVKSGRNKTIDISLEEGQRYLAGAVKIESAASLEEITDKTILGDCLDVMSLLPEGFADLVIADPPYNLDKDYNGRRFRKTSDEVYAKFTESWVKKVIPLLKPEASLYVCCDWKSGSVIESILKKYFIIRNRITWQREKGRGALNNWKNGMEDIWFAVKDPENYFFNVDAVMMKRKVIAPYKIDGKPKDWSESAEGNFRLTCPSNFWDDISVPFWSMPENTDHPTQKPEKLYAKLILASTREGDIVFDPFLGSGTASVVAKKLGRRYCGIEQNEEYCLWAEKRLLLADSDKSIQGYSDGVFWERNTSLSRTRKKEK